MSNSEQPVKSWMRKTYHLLGSQTLTKLLQQSSALISIVIMVIAMLGFVVSLLVQPTRPADQTTFDYLVSVRDSTTEEPVSNAIVIISRPDYPPLGAYTDSLGQVRFALSEDLSGRRATFTIAAEGYVRRQQELVLGPDQPPFVLLIEPAPPDA